MDIFVLNLERSKERKERMIQMFESFGIKNYEFITGTDYRDFNSFECLEKHAKSLGINSDKAEFKDLVPVCVSQSQAMDKLSKLDEYFIYMEDDVDLLHDVRKIEEEFMKIRHLNPDVVHLLSFNRPWHGIREEKSRLFKCDSRVADTRSLANIYSPDFARVLSKEVSSKCIPLDTIQAHIPYVDSFFAYPYMALENETCLESLLGEDNMMRFFFKKKYLSEQRTEQHDNLSKVDKTDGKEVKITSEGKPQLA